MTSGSREYDLLVNGEPLRVEVVSPGSLSIAGREYDCELSSSDGRLHRLTSGTAHSRIYLKRIAENRLEVWIKHYVVQVDLSDERDRLLARYGRQDAALASLVTLRAPMPGIVTSIRVKPGESIESGSRLLILEAMKMENEIRSPSAGKIKSILVGETTPVEKGQSLLTIEPE